MLTIGVLRGGPGWERDFSLLSGERFIQTLTPKYKIIDIEVSQRQDWLENQQIKTPDEILKKCDLVINALLGDYGEDGQVQQILVKNKIPFVGSPSLASKIANNKILTKKVFQNAGLKVPRWRQVNNFDDILLLSREIFNTFLFPVVVKPTSSGSSVGVSIARDLTSLQHALHSVFHYCDTAIVEEYIKGCEFSCVVLENFRQQKFYTFPPIETKRLAYTHHSFHDKVTGIRLKSELTTLTPQEKELIRLSAIHAHQAVGARHYSCSDFILHPKRGLFILESNTNPKLTPNSVLDKSLKLVGVKDINFAEHLINLL